MPPNHAAQVIPIVPLARDEQGHPISVPSEAAFWRVRRHTRGRPRNVAGIDREPLKVPLDFTEEDLHNMLGPGTYRLDLYDQAGESLDLTVTASVGEPEPGPPPAASELPAGSLLPIGGSDIRLVLEANVRATQLAFQHNERTLVASLKVAETLRDGVQVLAQSQADWIKAMANAKGFFRNAGPPILSAPRAPDPPENDEEEEDSEDSDEPDNHAHLYALGAEVMRFVNVLMSKGSDGASRPRLSKAAGGFDWRALLDWRRAAANVDEGGCDDSQVPISTTELLRFYSSLPDDVRSKLDHLRVQLSPHEQTQLVSALGGLAVDELTTLMTELAAMPADEIALRVRAQLAKSAKE